MGMLSGSADSICDGAYMKVSETRYEHCDNAALTLIKQGSVWMIKHGVIPGVSPQDVGVELYRTYHISPASAYFMTTGGSLPPPRVEAEIKKMIVTVNVHAG